MNIGIDVMGGDFAPQATILGAIMALEEIPATDRIVLIGNEKIILETLKSENADPSRFNIVHTEEVIEMDDKPIKAMTQKTKSNLVVGFSLLKDKKIDSLASAGNTGAMLVGAMNSVGTIEGLLRPCLAAFLPKEDGGFSVLVDVGVNPDSKPEHLHQYGLVGKLYAEKIFKIANPKVGLLNVGSEEGKGNARCVAAYDLMKTALEYNFIGNVETRKLFKGDDCHVFVCDGFVGNMLLKHTEAMWYVMYKRGLVDDYMKRFNYELYGGMPLLGVNGTVIIGHGISSKLAIKNMILQSKQVFESKINEQLKDSLAKL